MKRTEDLSHSPGSLGGLICGCIYLRPDMQTRAPSSTTMKTMELLTDGGSSTLRPCIGTGIGALVSSHMHLFRFADRAATPSMYIVRPRELVRHFNPPH